MEDKQASSRFFGHSTQSVSRNNKHAHTKVDRNLQGIKLAEDNSIQGGIYVLYDPLKEEFVLSKGLLAVNQLVRQREYALVKRLAALQKAEKRIDAAALLKSYKKLILRTDENSILAPLKILNRFQSEVTFTEKQVIAQKARDAELAYRAYITAVMANIFIQSIQFHSDDICAISVRERKEDEDRRLATIIFSDRGMPYLPQALETICPEERIGLLSPISLSAFTRDLLGEFCEEGERGELFRCTDAGVLLLKRITKYQLQQQQKLQDQRSSVRCSFSADEAYSIYLPKVNVIKDAMRLDEFDSHYAIYSNVQKEQQIGVIFVPEISSIGHSLHKKTRRKESLSERQILEEYAAIHMHAINQADADIIMFSPWDYASEGYAGVLVAECYADAMVAHNIDLKFKRIIFIDCAEDFKIAFAKRYRKHCATRGLKEDVTSAQFAHDLMRALYVNATEEHMHQIVRKSWLCVRPQPRVRQQSEVPEFLGEAASTIMSEEALEELRRQDGFLDSPEPDALLVSSEESQHVFLDEGLGQPNAPVKPIQYGRFLGHGRVQVESQTPVIEHELPAQKERAADAVVPTFL